MAADKKHIGRMVTVTVEDIGAFEVPLGLNLREALRREGVYIDGTCSDNGICGRCIVRVIDGNAGLPSPQERGLLGKKAASEDYRLACKIVVTEGLHVSIDPERILELDHTGKWKQVWDSPLWRPDLFAADRDGFGVAVDLGTTSIASGLLDLACSKPMDLKVTANPQLPWGEEIISRLGAATNDPGIAVMLGILVWGTIKDQIHSLCLRNGVSRGRINRITVVGNSAMHHLALGLPVEDLLTPPYSPSEKAAMTLVPEDLPVNLELGKNTKIYMAPLIGGYAGSDALASFLAGKFRGISKGAIIDVGTNTEIVVWQEDVIKIASAPSGPAFEGGHIKYGMRAENGAIWKVEIDGEKVVCDVVGNGKAEGICGTGMIDAVASMLRNGILDRTGLMKAGSHPMLKEGAFILDEETGVALTNEDIATLQKAVSAVSTTLQLLLKALGVKTGDLDSIVIGGSFGSRINIQNAMKTGFLPQLPAKRYILAGNTALVGALMMLASGKIQEEAELLAKSARHHDLTDDPEFEEVFIDNLYFSGI